MGTFYTGKGDRGETDTMGLGRMGKDSKLAAAIGDVDELNSAIGVAIANLDDEHIAGMLKSVQNRLFSLGAELAASKEATSAVRGRIKESDVKELEAQIDEFGSRLPPLKKFVLPGGSISASYLHLTRSVARRAERSVVSVSKEKQVGQHVLSYLNRLSSFLFVLALIMNKKEGVEELNPSY
jgi:cob(I)alamin adenosyltransferase